MDFHIHKQFLSVNYESIRIPVEFLILHYTASGLKQTLNIFQDSKSKVSSHFIVDTDGQIFEMVPCMENNCLKAWHAGKSVWTENEHIWENFNDFSIGVELVNKNGNLFPYTSEQYQALYFLLTQLKNCYSALKKPQRILGHEHIAGHRGKVDPGHQFDWSLFFQMNYDDPKRKDSKSNMALKKLKSRLAQKSLRMFSNISHQWIQTERAADEDWMKLNIQMEQQCLKDQIG